MPAQLARRRLRHDPDVSPPRHDAGVLAAAGARADRATAGTWMATQDFNMMALCGTRQRTEDQWRRLLAEAGLRVTGVYFPKDGQSEGVIEAEVA